MWRFKLGEEMLAIFSKNGAKEFIHILLNSSFLLMIYVWILGS